MHGTVRVTASVMIGAEVLPAAMRTFSVANPGVNIELSLSNAKADLLRRDADVAVRMAPPVRRHCSPSASGASGSAFMRIGSIWNATRFRRRMEDLVHHVLIGFDNMPDYLKGFEFAGRPLSREVFPLPL